MARSREAIIRILAALKAKIAENSGCTPQERDAALEQYTRMMNEYNIQDTEIHIKQHGVGRQDYRAPNQGSQKPEWYYILPKIGKLTDTRITWNLTKKAAVIYGTPIDREYAEFVIRNIVGAIETSWKAYRFSWDYTRQSKQTHGRHIRNTFRKAMVVRLGMRIDELIAKNKTVGTGLIVLKQELIEAFRAEEGTKITKGTKIALRSNLESTVYQAFGAADRVDLQYKTENETRLLEAQEGGD